MRVVIFTLIGIIAFYGAMTFINKFDNENRIDVDKKGLMSFLIFLSTILLYFKFEASVEFYVYFYLSIYLIITGYIDYKTKNVYTIFNYITIFLGILYLIYQKSIGIDIKFTIMCVIIYVIFTKIMGYLNSFGGGDTDIFIALSIFVSSINFNTFPLVILLLNMILSNVILVISNIRLVDFKRGRLKEERAFAPSIALSTITIILLL